MPKKTPSTSKKPPTKTPSGPWLVGLLVLAIVALAVVRIVSNHAGGGQPGATSALIGQKVASSITSDLASAPLKNVPGQGWARPSTPKGQLPDVHGKPVFLYMGAEYCPYCAAERWAIVVALDRFGTFKGLRYMLSSGTDVYANTPTVTFHGATYASSYVDFEPVEMTTRNPNTRLETPTPAQTAYFTANNPQTAIPFVAVGGRFVWISSAYTPGLLKGLTWSQIASDVDHPKPGSVGGQILQNANILTAAICSADGQKPARVCSSPVIKSLATTLP